MADASQLKRSLYMLADFVGTKVPAVLVLNMMDVAQGPGITVDTGRLSEKLGIPVVPMFAIRKKDYGVLYETMDKALKEKPMIDREKLASAILTGISAVLRPAMEKINVHPLLGGLQGIRQFPRSPCSAS